MTYELHVTLQSDATFGRGDGLAGLVDTEVEHDPATGLPFIRGRVLKGLLAEECANILFALEQSAAGSSARQAAAQLQAPARFLFGQSGSGLEDGAQMRLDPARLPDALIEAVRADVRAHRVTTEAVLNALTTIRRQTAQDDWGAPRENSLRAQRALLRGAVFVAAIRFDATPDALTLGLLAACTRAVHRGGTGRNRGRGRLQMRLFQTDPTDVTEACSLHNAGSFAALVRGTWSPPPQPGDPQQESQPQEPTGDEPGREEAIS